jgi:hypothetical protein
MVAVSMDEAKMELRLIEDRLEECVKEAWKEFRGVQAALYPEMRVRVRRNLLQGLVVKQIERAFAGVPGFHIIDSKCGRVLLVVADRVVLQFRHIRDGFKTANINTKTAREFDEQRYIDGFPPLPRITIGYRLDKLETAVSGVYVIFNVGKRTEWHYPLNDAGSGSAVEVLQLFPNDPAHPETSAADAKHRVGPKRPANSEETKVIPIRNETQ